MNKLYTLLLILIVLISFSAKSQTTDFGNPIGWKSKVSKNDIPINKMPGFDLDQIKFEDSINDAIKAGPWRFGYKYDTDFTLSNSGIWKTLPNGDRLWQLKISCPGALTVNLLLENFNLPEGAKLYLYDAQKTNYIGAYTHKNNRVDQLLGTELVYGDKIIIELYEPKSVQNESSITISHVIHGYRSLAARQNQLEKSLNSSGDCNIDVNCPLGIGWSSQIRSVAMIVVGGNGACSGALVNNTCDDGTPYFLTANHCLSGSEGNWAFRFNWESPIGTESCATTDPSTDPGPPHDETANGATVLANDAGSDFALLEIDNMTEADAQNWNCFYAGWDHSDVQNVTQATGIHHPSGDVKKICRESDIPYHATQNGKAVWMINDWEEGVTEPGSSGSPLFNQFGRIIGQLYGGSAACSGTSSSGSDYYGRFGVSWNNGISDYLTDCGSSSTTNNGYDPNGSSLPNDVGIVQFTNPFDQEVICDNEVGPAIQLKNYGINTLTSATIIYSFDGGPDIGYNWTGNLASGASETVYFNLVNLTTGNHSLTARAENPNDSTDQNISNNDATVDFYATVNGVSATLNLTLDCYGTEITWDITNGNNDIVYSGGPYTDNLSGASESIELCLEENQCYDFTINDSFGDGMEGDGFCFETGDYEIVQYDGTVLAEMIAADGAFGSQEVNNFCVGESNANLNEYELEYTIFPNPAENNLNIQYENNNGLLNLQIYDISGKVIFAKDQINTNEVIDLSPFSAGYYTVRMYNENINVTEKLIKE